MQTAPRFEPADAEAPSLPSAPSAVTSRGRLFRDRLAGVLVRAGGLAVVLSLVGILAFLVVEVAPLFRAARVAPDEAFAATPAASAPAALFVDPSLARLAAVSPDGTLAVLDAASGARVAELSVPDGPIAGLAAAPGESTFAALDADGGIRVFPLAWDVDYAAAGRVVQAALGEPLPLRLDVPGAQVGVFTARAHGNGTAAVALASDGRLHVVRTEVRTNDFTGERDERSVRFVAPAPEGVTRLVLDPELRQLYGADDHGSILWWEIGDDAVRAPRVVDAGSPVTALTLLVGGRSLVAGHADGSLSVWFRVQTGRAHAELVRAHVFPSQGGAIRQLAPSWRKRTFAALGEDGELGLYHSTSERVLWRGRVERGAPVAAVLAPRGDALFVASDAGIARFDVRNPHPETSFASLAAPVWYEDSPGPEWVWQSTGGSEDFESKLSLTPLALGTLKGTFYALFFAIPLGILGALYTSQLMDPRLQRWIKPTVEIMASLPSVVLGFLAGLWLAPRLERWFPGLLLLMVLAPLLALVAGALFRALPARWRGRLPAGTEVALAAALLAGGAVFAFSRSPEVEAVLFGGDFAAWLAAHTGLAYDQRNAVVAGVAMAFAVIPILFAIAEESLSNVPRTLTAASLALGATRWQTLARVVLPAASPGLFAAVMIGFGRAVGETMIVLMATGNTPLLGWSPFDGFRTLSANIAVEIPEAPYGATLYRVLFLSALLLFAVTFVLNTAADLVRESLRKRFSGS